MGPRYSREWLDYFIPETIDWSPGQVPDTSRAVMKNLLGPRSTYPHGVPDSETLRRYEGFASYTRMQQLADTPIPGRYDLDHFQRIHHHLFQDVYPWAGQLRTAPQDWPMVKWGPDVAAIRNGQNHVTEIPHKYFKAREVPQAATVVLDRIAAKDNLRGLARNDFIGELATVWLRINFVHPFREGNTRAQFSFFRQLSAEAGYRLDTDRFHAVSKTELKQNPLVGDLREQFVWGRFEYMQTGDTRLMRDVLDQAITDAADPDPAGPIIDHGVDLRAITAAMSAHPRSVHDFTANTSAPDPVTPPVDPPRSRPTLDLDC
ncbi:cell filamentation protein Fic (plasmid) [Rhodococcus sp. p52]|uniref:Fic/DOC family protein n=1 Tax=Rhodococcus sp. p52 TaxID=935199 RepID=UPI00051A08D8|nr:Fic family protein [Rhodococcus sp. p52]AOD24828.1 cell filamentation protein Fic [Rhodococcus sp. p52]